MGRSAVVVALSVALGACGWPDADRGRNTDHDPPPGEDGSAPPSSDPTLSPDDLVP